MPLYTDNPSPKTLLFDEIPRRNSCDSDTSDSSNYTSTLYDEFLWDGRTHMGQQWNICTAMLGLLSMAVGTFVVIWILVMTVRIVEGEVGMNGWKKEGFGGGR
jgi:hypothetical protein